MGPIWDAELRVWDAKNFGLVSPGTHINKFVKKITGPDRHFFQRRTVNIFLSISPNICFGAQMNCLLERDLLGSHS